MKIVLNLIFALFSGLLLYFLYIVTVLKKEKKLNNFLKNGQVLTITKKYKIDITKMDKKKTAKTIMKANSLILSIACFIAMFFENTIIAVGIGFIIMLILIYLEYKYLGKKLKKEVI